MGREVKRVPLDFDWPMGTAWPGYYLTLCHIMEEPGRGGCELCKRFAILADIVRERGCPKTEIEPPAGDGWQMWETVSEGSPVSPVFATPEELARWLADHPVGVTSDCTYEHWLRMIHVGWVPSLVYAPGMGVASGAAAGGCGRLDGPNGLN